MMRNLDAVPGALRLRPGGRYVGARPPAREQSPAGSRLGRNPAIARGGFLRPDELERLLSDVREGRLPVTRAAARLVGLPSEPIGSAVLDHGREARTGIPEVVLAEGKTAEQILEICRRMWERSGRLFVTRASESTGRAVVAEIPGARHSSLARTVVAGGACSAARDGVAVVCAGTADLPVAEEAAETLQMLGQRPQRLYDVGVAGLHRLTDRLEDLRRARAIVAVAGMEGALPSVLAGLVGAPVIGVPTSVGYGAALGGLASLLAMLNACAPGLSVVNVDNGFGAACVAARINAGGSDG